MFPGQKNSEYEKSRILLKVCNLEIIRGMKNRMNDIILKILLLHHCVFLNVVLIISYLLFLISYSFLVFHVGIQRISRKTLQQT